MSQLKNTTESTRGIDKEKVNLKFKSRPGYKRNELKNNDLRQITSCQSESASLDASITFANESLNLVQTDMEVKFKPARLVIPANQKRWYINVYIFDELCGQLVRKRFYQIPEEPNFDKRKFLGEQICYEINKKLYSGMVSNRSKFLHEQALKNLNPDGDHSQLLVTVALWRIIEAKRLLRERSLRTYIQIGRMFTKYLHSLKPEPNIARFNLNVCKAYANHMIDIGYAPRTMNNHILALRTLWQSGIEMNLFKDNPWKSIPRRKTPTGRNIAYLPHQVQEILEYSTKYPYLKLLIKFMYYTLMRTNELGHLQVKHIGMYTQGKIYLPAHLSKNNMERHIVIPPALMQEIQQHGILKMNPEWYLFGKEKFKPGPVRMPTVRMGQKYREWVLSKLNYPADYTLYSWKHTGVIAAHKAGVKDDDIMLQTGHKDYGSFQMYLKSLSLFENENFARLIPTI